MNSDPFAKLVRSKTQLDMEEKQRLADLLEPYVWLVPDDRAVVFKDNVPSLLTTLQRVLIFVLARKVIALLTETDGSVSPLEVEIGTGLPGGTVRPKLLTLLKQKLLVRSDGVYEISPYFSIVEIEKTLKSRSATKEG